MGYEVVGSSSTDDDNPQPQYHRVPVGYCLAGNSRSFLSSAPHQRMQSDMELEIHNLERVAYGAVLRALKAQSDALTWEKEGLITELRKELRVSDDEHRELLAGVSTDDHIRRIREWREGYGHQNVAIIAPQHVNNRVASPTVSASRTKQKASISGNPFGTPSQSLHPQTVAPGTQPPSSTVKRGPTSGIGGRRTNAGQPAFTIAKHMQYQLTDHVSSGDLMDDPSESIHDPLIGRRVMIRWPADNKFYEAVITEYNPVDGNHSFVYNSNPNATVEWVNIKEVPHEDIRWVGDDPIISQLGEASASPGWGKPSSMNQFANEIPPSGKGVMQDSGEIEIFHTGTLIKKVEKVLNASHPDELELDKAKKLLKEHEQTLIQVIAKLSAACDGDGEHPLGHGPSIGRQHNGDYHGPRKLETAGGARSYESGRR